MEITWEHLRRDDADETARQLHAEITALRRRADLLEHALHYVEAHRDGHTLDRLPYASTPDE